MTNNGVTCSHPSRWISALMARLMFVVSSGAGKNDCKQLFDTSHPLCCKHGHADGSLMFVDLSGGR
jgi:hypothetical protein